MKSPLLLDANLLIYAFREELPQHERAREWLSKTLATDAVGLPTPVEMAFLRLMTQALGPLKAAPWPQAWGFITSLLDCRGAQRVMPGAEHPEIFDRLARRHRLRGDQLVDGWIAALAVEKGGILASADKGFGRFPEVRWLNPLES